MRAVKTNLILFSMLGLGLTQDQPMPLLVREAVTTTSQSSGSLAVVDLNPMNSQGGSQQINFLPAGSTISFIDPNNPNNNQVYTPGSAAYPSNTQVYPNNNNQNYPPNYPPNNGQTGWPSGFPPPPPGNQNWGGMGGHDRDGKGGQSGQGGCCDPGYVKSCCNVGNPNLPVYPQNIPQQSIVYPYTTPPTVPATVAETQPQPQPATAPAPAPASNANTPPNSSTGTYDPVAHSQTQNAPNVLPPQPQPVADAPKASPIFQVIGATLTGMIYPTISSLPTVLDAGQGGQQVQAAQDTGIDMTGVDTSSPSDPAPVQAPPDPTQEVYTGDYPEDYSSTATTTTTDTTSPYYPYYPPGYPNSYPYPIYPTYPNYPSYPSYPPSPSYPTYPSYPTGPIIPNPLNPLPDRGQGNLRDCCNK